MKSGVENIIGTVMTTKHAFPTWTTTPDYEKTEYIKLYIICIGYFVVVNWGVRAKKSPSLLIYT